MSVYLFRLRKGGCTNACISMGIHSLYYRTVWCLRNLKCSWPRIWIEGVSAISAEGRILCGAKIGHGRRGWSPSSQKFFFRPEGYSNKTNQMHSNDLEACGKEVLLVLVPFHSKIWYQSQRSQQGPRSVPAWLQRRWRLVGDLAATKSVAARFLNMSEFKFWRVFNFVILPNAICKDFYAAKCLIHIYFVLFPCL